MSVRTDDLSAREEELPASRSAQGATPAGEWSVLAPQTGREEERGSLRHLRGLVRGPGGPRPLLAIALAWVVTGAVVGGLAGAVWGGLHPPQASASADIIISSNVSLTGDMQVFDVTDRQVATQQALLSSPAVAAEASRLSKLDLPTADVSSSQNSNLLVVSTVQATPALARRAVTAYVQGYFAMVSAKQRAQLQGALGSAQQSAAAATAELAQLDSALSGVSATDRSTLLSVQSAERLALTQQAQDAEQTQLRIKASMAGLPVNVEGVPGSTTASTTGLSAPKWAVLGLLAGGTVGVIIVMRIAERRRGRPAA